MRSHDILARIGGEEFAILMPGASPRDGERACERVRRALEREPVGVGTAELAVTASFGSASLRHDELCHEIIARADAALYEAKNAGRNVVRLAA